MSKTDGHEEDSLVSRMAWLIDHPSAASREDGDPASAASCLALLRQLWSASERAAGQHQRVVSTNNEALIRASESLPQQLGRFELRELLGIGGFGIVYRAFDPLLDREVALKLPRPEILFSESLRERFMREAQVAALLDHPGIVPVFETGQTWPAWYIVTGVVRGPTLAAWLGAQAGPVCPRVAAQLVERLAHAVHHAHIHGVLHRDLKPTNVLLEPRSAASAAELPFEPKVSDFGLAKRLDEAVPYTQSQSRLGTLTYMAPEQVADKLGRVSVPTDVYALGTILYEVLMGRPPFAGGTEAETCRLIEEQDPAPLRRTRPDVSRDLEAICLKCLAKHPDNRYATAELLAQDLRHYLRFEPTLARPLRSHQRITKWCVRRPLVATLLVAVMLSTIAGLAGVAWQWRRAERHLRETRLLLYAANLKLAEAAWEQHNSRDVTALLSPFASPSSSADDIRGWEWYYYHRLCHQDVATHTLDQSIDWLDASPAASIVVIGGANGQICALDPLTLKPRWTLDAFSSGVLSVRVSGDGKQCAAIDIHGHVKRWKLGTEPHLIHERTLTYGILVAAAFDSRLDRVAVSDREFRIHLLKLDAPTETALFSGHSANVKPLVFSDDDTCLLSGSEDGSVRLWKIGTGQPDFTAVHPKNQWIVGIAMSHDGRWIAAGAQDGMLYVWERGAATPLLSIQAHQEVTHSVRFSGDTKRIVTAGNDRAVRVWAFPSGERIRTVWGHEDPASQAQLWQDSRHLLSAGKDGSLKLWDLSQPDFEDPPPLDALVGGIAFAPSGSSAAVRFLDGTVTVYGWPGMREVYRFVGPPGHDALAYDAEHERCAVSRSDGAIEVWQRQTRLHVLTRHAKRVNCLSFSDNARWLAAASQDSTVSIWDAATGALLHHVPLNQEREVTTVVFCPRSPQFVALTNNQVAVVDAPTGRVLQTLVNRTGRVYSAAFSPDGTRLAVGDRSGTITIWDMRRASPIATLSGHTDRVFGCCLAPDGKRLVSCSRDTTIRWWDLRTMRELCAMRGKWGFLEGLALSPDGWTLCAIGEDNLLHMWDPRRSLPTQIGSAK